MGIHTFYADEAGHAGANYLDDRQPFHVAAGYLVPDEKKEAFLRELSGISRQGVELKGSRLAKTPGGQRRLLAALRALHGAGGVPFFWAMERRFCIAGKLVDVFLDTAYYQACSWLPLWDLEQRLDVTEKLVDVLSLDVLRMFGAAYRHPEIASWDSVLVRVIDELTTAGEKRLAGTFSGARAGLERIVDSEDMGAAHANRAALNIPALMHTLRMVDRFVDFRGGTFELVHDANVQFEKDLQEIPLQLRTGKEQAPDYRLPSGELVRLFLRNLESVQFADSSAVAGLQAADLLASAIARVVRDIPEPPEQWTPEVRELASLVLPPILHEQPLLGGMYAHIGTKTRLIVAMMGLKTNAETASKRPGAA